MNPRIVKINEKLFFKASKSLKLLDILKFTFNKNQEAFIQIIDISSDDSIDDYLDIQNYEIDNIEPDTLSSFHFSLPHLCWLPHGDNDQHPAYNQNGDYTVLNEKEISKLIKKEEDTEKIGIFQRRQYNSNTDKPSLTIVSGANSSGKTLFLKKYSLEQANIRPTIIICSDSMESQYLDIVAKSYKFGKDLFYPPVPSPLYDTENHFDLTINSLFREYPFSPHMKSRMNRVLKEKFPNTKLLGNNEFKILHDSVQVDDSALAEFYTHLSRQKSAKILPTKYKE